jgi:hypothetical protein
MLFNPNKIIDNQKKKPTEEYPYDKYFPKQVSFIGEPWTVLSKHIGKLEPGAIINFWTWGRYGMGDIINYIVRQIGPSKVNASTWAISVGAVTTIINRMKDGLITDMKLWLDPRVTHHNPEPLQLCKANFPTLLKPVHAKVTTFENKDWKISVSGSLNLSSNPQPERGIIQCIDHVFEFDNLIIENEFRK